MHTRTENAAARAHTHARGLNRLHGHRAPGRTGGNTVKSGAPRPLGATSPLAARSETTFDVAPDGTANGRAGPSGARAAWMACGGCERGRAVWAREGRRGRGEGVGRAEGRDRPGMCAGPLRARGRAWGACARTSKSNLGHLALLSLEDREEDVGPRVRGDGFGHHPGDRCTWPRAGFARALAPPPVPARATNGRQAHLGHGPAIAPK